jgi:ABC-type multidrug transport system fused ATPase/permease subunit
MPGTPPTSLWHVARAERRSLVVGVALAIAQAGALVPIPLLVARVFDRAIPDADAGALVVLAVAIVGCSTLNAIAAVGAQTAVLRASRGISASLRRSTVDAIGRVSIVDLRRSDAGRLHDLMVQDTARVDSMTATVALMLLPAALVVVGIAGVLVAIEPALAAALGILAPAMAIVTRLIRSRVSAATDDTHDAIKRYHGAVLRWTGGQELIRVRGRSEAEAAVVGETIDALRISGARRQVAVAQFSAVQLVLVAAASGVVLVLGGSEVIDGAMTAGELLAFYAAVGLARTPLSQLVTSYPVVVDGRLAWRRISKLLTLDQPEPYGPGRVVRPTRELRLDDVSYAYPQRSVQRLGETDLAGHMLDEAVVAHRDLTVRRGEVVALVGPSGCGKSTILALLLGFVRPSAGTASADGVAYDDLDIAALRSSIGVVQQHPELFAGTIRQAVTFGHDDVTADALVRALAIAGADFVHRLPGGMDAVIGDGGEALSGGQRQRLAVARALLGDPAFLVLDEPTNHLDELSVRALLDALGSLPQRPGILVVTHRPELADVADVVVDLDPAYSTVP